MVDETPLKIQLLEKDLVDEDLIDAATDRVSAYGGDLASQLLIMGAVDERDLLEALGDARQVEPADPDVYDRIDPDALATIERPLLLEYSIIPFQKHRRNLGVFVVEPLSDETISELSETHGVRISQYIWPRLRFHQTLAALSDEPLPDWAEDFDDGVELSFAEDLEVPSRDGESLTANSSPAIGRPVSEPHLEPDEVEFAELGHGWSRDQILEFIEQCYNRDAVLHALLGYADWWLENRMIVVLGKDSIQPYLIDGWAELPEEFESNERLRQLRVPVDPSAAIFEQDQVGHFLADKPEDVGLGDLFVELTLFPPDRLLNQSIKIGNRPYMMLVGEPRTDMPDVPPGIERVEEVAVQVGKQLESIIRAAKTDALPPEGERIPPLPEPEGDFDEEVGDLEAARREAREDETSRAEEDEASENLDFEIQESAPSGRTLDGTGESYAELKEKVEDDSEMSAPQLAGSSESDSARQTQHIGERESEHIVDEDVSAPRMEEDQRTSRQTQAIPPGQAASSSATDESDLEIAAEDDEVSSTSFGIPFVDEPVESPESDASDASEAASSPSEPQPAETSEPRPAETSEPRPAETSEPQPAETSEPQSATKQGGPASGFDIQDSNSTMLGGFTVDDSQSSFAEQTEKRDANSSSAVAEVEEEYSGEEGPSLESLGSGTSFAEEQSQGEDIPKCQIVKFVSLANGRQSLEESSDDTSEAEPEDIPSDSGGLDSGGIAFKDEDLEETADLLDSRNPANAFNAAEQIVEWGGRAVEELRKRFPGRLFVDRYEYTSRSLPPVEEHGPVIAALAKLGDRAVSLVADHLEDSSVELRFYATLLFKELPPDSVTEKLEERLFDRDMMIRDVAADILIENTDDNYRQERLMPRLRDEVESARDDLHVEVAARLLGRLRDRYAVPTLIEALENSTGKVQQTIQGALATITYKKLSPSVSEWRNWWASAHEKSREDWIVEALNHESEDVRRLVHHELQAWDGLDLDYHPEQPKKLRERAQKHLREWFDARE